MPNNHLTKYNCLPSLLTSLIVNFGYAWKDLNANLEKVGMIFKPSVKLLMNIYLPLTLLKGDQRVPSSNELI